MLRSLGTGLPQAIAACIEACGAKPGTSDLDRLLWIYPLRRVREGRKPPPSCEVADGRRWAEVVLRWFWVTFVWFFASKPSCSSRKEEGTRRPRGVRPRALRSWKQSCRKVVSPAERGTHTDSPGVGFGKKAYAGRFDGPK